MKVNNLTWSLFGLLAFILSLKGTGQSSAVLINSYFNAINASGEWTELIVVQDNVSLNNWSIRDNASSGNWQPSISFRDIPYWANLRRGTIIVINHRAIGNLPTNTDKTDGFIRVSADDLSFFSYSGSTFPSSALDLSANGDMIQLRDAQLNHRHALGHRNHATDTTIAYFNGLSAPKYSHNTTLSNNEALMFCPGANENDFGYLSPWIGNSYTAKSTTKVAGLPSPCVSNDGNREFWRSLRQPDWSNPTANANYNPENNQVTLQWSPMPDAHPSDFTHGYLVLRSNSNSFQHPNDGFTYTNGQTIGSATVVAHIQGSLINTFIDNVNLSCNQTVYYRVYAYRYTTDQLLGNNQNLARGRAYNETNFAQTSVTRTNTTAEIMISASATTVLPGTVVTFTTTQLVNGGNNPAISWFVNNQQVGNGSSFQYTVNQAIQVYAMLTSNLGCVSPNPVPSNIISINIASNPCSPGQISGSSVICINSSETYTIVGGSTGGTWSSSNPAIATVMGNGLTANIVTHGTGSFTLSYTLPAGCTGQNYTSKVITVNPDAAAGPDQHICGSLSTQLQGNSHNSGDAFWIIHDGPSFLVNYSPNIYSPTVQISVPVAGIYTFRWSIVGSSCSTSDLVVVEFKDRKQVSVAIENYETVCAGMPLTLKALPVNGGINPHFQWFHNNNPAGSNSQTFSFTPQQGDQVRVEITSSLDCVVSPYASSVSVTVQVKMPPTEPFSVTSSSNTICTGHNTPIVLNAEGGSGSVLNWYKDHCTGIPIGSGTSLTVSPPSQTTTYFARWETESCGVSNCKSVTIEVVDNANPSVSISSNISGNSICSGQLVVFTAQAENGGSNPVHQWFVNGVLQSNNEAVFSTTQLSGPSAVVRCSMTSSLQCLSAATVNSNSIEILVNETVAPSIAIASNQTNVCSSIPVQFWVTNVTGEGNQPSYQWKINGTPVPGAVLNTFTTTLETTAVITCSMFSNANCVSIPQVDSNPVVIQVTPTVQPSITINPTASTYCAGQTIQFRSVAVNGGTNPQYQWFRNDTLIPNQTNWEFYTSALAPGTHRIKVRLKSNRPCPSQEFVFSEERLVTIVAFVTPSVSISASETELCSGSLLVLTATPSNQGANPTFKWLVNNIPQSNNGLTLTLHPTNTITVAFELTVAENCVTINPAISNTIQVNVLPWLEPQLTIQTSSSQLCSGTAVSIVANPTNQGMQPTYKWYVNDILQQTPNLASFTFFPTHQDVVKAELEASGNCLMHSQVISNSIEFTVLPNPEAPIQASADREVLCEGDAGTISLSALGGNGSTLSWYLNSCDGALIGQGNPLVIAAPQLSTSYFARWETPGCGISACSQVNITVNQQITPNISIAASQNGICTGDVVHFIASVSGQGTNPQYQWMVNGVNTGENSNIFSYSPQNGDIVQCNLFSSESCASPNNAVSEAISMLVNPTLSPSISIGPQQVSTCEGTIVVFEASPEHGGPAPTYRWIVNNILNSETGNTLQLNNIPGNYEVYAVLQSSEICAQPNIANSNTAQLSVNPLVQPNIQISASQQSVCEGETVLLGSLIENGGQSPLYQWYVNNQAITGANSSSYSFIPSNSDIVRCELISNHPCAAQSMVSSASIQFQVSSTIMPSVSIAHWQNTICEGSSIDIVASTTGTGNSPEYQWYVNGELFGNSATLTFTPQNQDRVYCMITSDLTCAQPAIAYSDTLTIEVRPVINAVINISTQFLQLCEGTMVTVEAITEHPGALPKFSWRLNDNEIGANQSFLSFVPDHNDQLFCLLESNASCVSNPIVTSNVLSFSVMDVFEPTIAIASPSLQICEGESVTIHSFVATGNFQPTYQWYINGVATGHTAETLYYVPNNNDQVQCQISVDAQCANPSVTWSNELVIIVKEFVQPAIQLIESHNQLCFGESVTINASTSSGGNNPVFQWFINNQHIAHADSVLSFLPSHNDEVYCILISEQTCAQPSTVISNTLLFDVADALVAGTTTSHAFCGEQNGTIGVTILGGISPYQYSISNGTTWTNDAFFSGLSAGDYQIHVIDSRNCSLQTPVSVTIEQMGAPQIQQLVLSPASGGLNNGTVMVSAVGQQPLLYSLDAVNWQISPVFSGLAAGNHVLYVKDQNGCISSQSYSIQTAEILLSADTSQNCKGGNTSIDIHTDGFANVGNFKIVIQFNPMLLEFAAINSIWSAIQTNQLTVTTNPGEIILTFDEGLLISYPGGGGLFRLNFNLLNQGTAVINISSDSYLVANSGNLYPLRFSQGSINISNGPDIVVNGNADVCQGTNLHLSISQTALSMAVWKKPDGSLVSGHDLRIEAADHHLSGVYTAILTDSNGCSNTNEIVVNVKLCDFIPSIPNAFRPSSNPPNNTFKPLFGPVIPEIYNLKIFNRWGQLVFETSDYLEGWSGKIDNNSLSDTYVYVLVYKLSSELSSSPVPKVLKGSVTLVK